MKTSVSLKVLSLFCVLTCGMCLSCGSPEDKKSGDTSTTFNNDPVAPANPGMNDQFSSVPESGTVSNDSVYLSGSYILFFGPSSEEVQMFEEKGNMPPGYMELINAADNLRRQMEDTLTAMRVPLDFSYSEASTVCITMEDGGRMYFNRRNLKFPAGMIMMDGMQPPAIRSANNTIQDYYRYVKDFFVNIDFPDSANPNV